MKYYGVPYVGSKSFYARWILGHLPRCARLIDAFAGGCAMTHAALSAGLAKSYVVNDISSSGVDLFRMCVAGLGFHLEWEWIGRDEFRRFRDADPLVRQVWSFGSKGLHYWCAKEVEPYFRAL